jgi:hypothetical protein
MQVGLSTDSLKAEEAFQKVCYGFAVFAIVSPIATVGTVVGVFIVMFFANWSRTVATQRKRFKDMNIKIPRSNRHRMTAGSGSVA